MPDAPLRPAGLVVVPFIDCWDLTQQALADLTQQLGGDVYVLAVNNGSRSDTRAAAERWAQQDYRKRALLSWDPPMPSLARCWNTALDMAWRMGHDDALVVNNDVRVGSWIYRDLRRLAQLHNLWVVTPVNCRDLDREAWQQGVPMLPDTLGGPDFSCFRIQRTCHERYRFDERFQPAYMEDSDYHRRMWLGGDGDRIGGAALPYLHYGSATINRSPEVREAFHRQFVQCRQRYIEKWGGEPHHERKITPDSAEDLDGVGTPGGYLGAIAPPQRDDARQPGRGAGAVDANPQDY